MELGVTEISAILAAAGVLVGVVYYVLDMRNQTRIRKTDMLMRLFSTGLSEELVDAYRTIINLQFKDYDDYVRQYGPLSKDSSVNRAFFKVVPYHEMAGLLLYRKLVDLVTIYDVWGGTNTLMLFEKVKPLIVQIRKNEPGAFVGFEYLCGELKRKEPELRKMINGIKQKTYIPE
jgi:hypothetical protein